MWLQIRYAWFLCYVCCKALITLSKLSFAGTGHSCSGANPWNVSFLGSYLGAAFPPTNSGKANWQTVARQSSIKQGKESLKDGWPRPWNWQSTVITQDLMKEEGVEKMRCISCFREIHLATSEWEESRTSVAHPNGSLNSDSGQSYSWHDSPI